MKHNFNYKQTIIALALAISIMVGSGFLTPRPAHAQVVTDIVTEVETALTSAISSVVSDFSNFDYIYKYVLNPLAWAAAKAMLQEITNSTVNWINSGFQGSPAFVQNPEGFFQNIGDNVAGNFIAGVASPLANLCSPIALNVRLALAINQANAGGNPYTCSLSPIIGNVQGATINGFEAGDFSQGGWPAFVSLAEPQNSFYGAYLESQADLDVQIQGKTVLNQNLLNQASGFLSYQKCTPTATSNLNASTPGSSLPPGAAANFSSSNGLSGGLPGSLSTLPTSGVANSVLPAAPPGSVGTTVTDPGTGQGENCQTVTPGSVIANSLTQGLNNGQLTLIAAQSLDEIIGSLAAQLVNQVLSNGLSSVSQPSNSQPSYLNQIEQEVINQNGGNIQQLSATLSSDLSTAINYGTQQQQTVSSSITIAESATTTLNSALATCENASDTPVVAQVNNLIASTTAIVDSLQAEDATLNSQMDSLNQLNSEIQTATSSAQLNALTQQYNSMLTSLPSLTTVQNAVFENGSVQSQITSIESQAKTLQNQCTTYQSTTTTIP